MLELEKTVKIYTITGQPCQFYVPKDLLIEFALKLAKEQKKPHTKSMRILYYKD